MTDFMDELEQLPKDHYLPLDRYRDFRRVFLETDEGKRVLRELLSWGRLFHSPIMGSPIDPYRMAIHLGEHNIAIKLLHTVYTEPKMKPTMGKKRESPDAET